jgi:hypothetical protein
MKRKFTGWFISGDKNPRKVGVYQQRRYKSVGPTMYAFWSGSGWGCMCYTPGHAYKWRNTRARYPSGIFWRGLLAT